MRDLPPVTTGLAIHGYIRAHLDAAGRLGQPDLELPDDERRRGQRVRWAAGALDGAFGHHATTGRASDLAARAGSCLLQACHRPSARNLRRLYQSLPDDVLSFLDPMVEAVLGQAPDLDALHGIGRWLATTATDRGPVKVGLAILGVTGIGPDVEIVRTLGAHDEFTLFAAVALGNGLAEPESELWALASAVTGWGRIQCVERLRHTRDPQIRAWILREGFRNSIMYEYLAFIAATTGGLLEALRDMDPDRELLTAAGEILEALAVGGPAEDMDNYLDGADAVAAYLGHMRHRAESLLDFHGVWAIRRFLAVDERWDERSQRGWTATRREAFEAACDEILRRDSWDDQIAVGLLSSEAGEFRRAERAARSRGIDTFDVHVRRIVDDPFEANWFHAWGQADRRRAEQLVALARELLPVETVASGLADELGLGPEWALHGALDWTLQGLRDHAGVGADLVLIGLRSPVTRNRNKALNALKEWPRSMWPTGARELVESLSRIDPNERTRGFAGELIG